MGVWQASAQISSLSLRARHNDFKLSISHASSMKGPSTMQKETKMKTLLASPSETESCGRRRTRTILTASTASVYTGYTACE